MPDRRGPIGRRLPRIGQLAENQAPSRNPRPPNRGIGMRAASEAIKPVKELSRKEIVFALARVPGTGRVVFGGSDARVYLVDFSAEKPEARELGAHESYVTGLAVSGRQAVSGSYDGRLIWWDTDSGSRLRAVDAHARW